MIHYQLRCDGGHGFEGWFPGSQSFETQAERGLLSCPHCGSQKVERGLMTPAVRTRAAAVPVPVPGTEVPRVMPDALRAVLQKLRVAVERSCDDVGDDFAAEALRMSRGEIGQRGIYGNTTDEDRDALAEEGVSVIQIPWLKPAEG